jgi:hypothetical protein
MFWKKYAHGEYEYVAITKMESVDEKTALYGQRHFRVTLADGSTERITFENDDWRAFECKPADGGMVLNGS